MPGESLKAYIVHIYSENRKDRLLAAGRLEDGRSFAAAIDDWRPCLHVYSGDLDGVKVLLARIKHNIEEDGLVSFEDNRGLVKLIFAHYDGRGAALELFSGAGIPCPDGDIKIPEQYLLERGIKGPVEIEGPYRKGRSVGLVFNNPAIKPLASYKASSLVAASIDIETDEGDKSVRAIAVSASTSEGRKIRGIVRLVPPSADGETGCVLENGGPVFFHKDEASLLRAFINDIQELDPDILTGWNFLDFDFPRIAERCEHHRIPLRLGRSPSAAKFFAAHERRSAAALVPGRQVIDALRVTRSSPERFADYTLDTVARAVLGEGKTVHSTGKRKLEELERLWREDPLSFAEYCYTDAELVISILEKTGLLRLTVERAVLTGVSLDKAWTSVVSFERIYGMELLKRNVMPPPHADKAVSGAAGGTVLEASQGLFNNIAVFDFRSLYPTIIGTFNIDPLSHSRAMLEAARGGAYGGAYGGAHSGAHSGGQGGLSSRFIKAPNGAVFARMPGILPELIASYFAERRAAIERKDSVAAYVYKILMNSFYGVMGTPACRYGRTELAGAITSFARKWLYCSRDWFDSHGFRVLYGDTDSLFVETGLSDGAGYGDFIRLCGELSKEVSQMLAEKIMAEYGLVSLLELRFDKAYRRFIIPPLRAGGYAEEARGRAKGYGGWLLNEDGSMEVEVKGMEAVRRDTTPLGRSLQLELLKLVFSGTSEERFREEVSSVIRRLTGGELDGELVYRKRLSRPPESYTASTPPQVKAARALGWKGRRGTVEYIWTTSGAEPASAQKSPIDYDHYIDSQILPVALSIASAAGFKGRLFPPRGRQRQALEDGQMELRF